ncbi:MAG: acyltransferase family protein [Aggregatilineales bacterium]
MYTHTRARQAPRRLLALDIVRGYAMLLMLISHSSWWLDDLDYGVAYGWDNMIVPTLVFPQSAMGFVLQLATPAFFLLSGFSVALFAAARRRRGWSEWRISRFFVIRGLLLIALDVTVVNLRLSPPHFGQHLSVLTGVGVCLLLMAWLRRLDWRALAAALAVVLMGTQLYYHSLAAAGDWPRDESLLRAVLLAPSVEDITWKTQFPAPGWLPIVLLGFIMGARTATGGAPLGRMALRVGLGCLALFALTMAAGDVGSLYPANPLVFSKHPPDLAYITLYTGLTCLLIALHSRPDAPNTAAPFRAVAVLGQTALFFYLVHIRLIELVSPLIARLPLEPLERSLLIVAATLPALLFLCAAYRFYKREHPDSILQYL